MTHLARSLRRRSFGLLPFRRGRLYWTKCGNEGTESVEVTTIDCGIAQLPVICRGMIYANVRSKEDMVRGFTYASRNKSACVRSGSLPGQQRVLD